MGPSQQCKTCRQKFSEKSPERNYDNWMNYNFTSKDDFKKHSSRNNKCPARRNDQNVVITISENPTIEEEREVEEEREEEESVINDTILDNIDELPLWPEYTKYRQQIDEDEYIREQLVVKWLEEKHH